MKVEGLSRTSASSATYGPGDPREVLLSLLEGSGYNVLMVGDAKGAPRELSLSQRSAASTVASAATTRNSREEEDDEVEQEVQQAPPEQPQPSTSRPGKAQTRRARNPEIRPNSSRKCCACASSSNSSSSRSNRRNSLSLEFWWKSRERQIAS